MNAKTFSDFGYIDTQASPLSCRNAITMQYGEGFLHQGIGQYRSADFFGQVLKDSQFNAFHRRSHTRLYAGECPLGFRVQPRRGQPLLPT